jgi:DNA-binding MarR family transcriptional regulator
MAINKTAELVKLWAEYEQTHTDAELEDFCRHYLIKGREKHNMDGFLGGNVPPGRDQMLIKLMGRVTTMFLVYAEHALKETAIEQFSEFTYLNTIQNMDRPKKTDVINDNFMELSSGLLLIDRLIKRGWIKEQSDKADKRSKRLELSETGIGVLYNCYMILEKLCALYFKDMSSDDLQLCLHLLTPVEIRHASAWQKNKAEGFRGVLKEIGK